MENKTSFQSMKLADLRAALEELGLDPAGTALRCFRCHTTGLISLAADGSIHWGEAGVQCESCHGPGAETRKQPWESEYS